MIISGRRRRYIGNLRKKRKMSAQELLDLAAVCEEVANSIEDRLTGG